MKSTYLDQTLSDTAATVDPEEVAHAILSLVIPAASFITGAALVVDGGLSIRNA